MNLVCRRPDNVTDSQILNFTMFLQLFFTALLLLLHNKKNKTGHFTKPYNLKCADDKLII